MSLLDAYGRPLPERDERMDAWQNPQTGLGIWGIDKTKAATYFPPYRVLDQELTGLFNGSHIAAKIVEKRPKEYFRRGFDLEADGPSASQTDAIREYATEQLELESNFIEGFLWGRLYGGAVALLNIDDGRLPSEPLDEENIRSFDSISIVDRRYAYVLSQYSAMGAQTKYGRPEIYLVSNAVAASGWNSHGAVAKRTPNELRRMGAQTSLVHESRVIRFDGNPTDVVTRQQLAGWTWSVLQRVYDAMRQFDGAFDAAGYLLSDASQGVFKLQGLLKAISSGQQAAFGARLQAMEMTRSVMRGVALDAGDKDGRNAEDFTRVPTPFSGIPELLDRMMLIISAAADMPGTEIFGRAPAGLNATGESDTRKWYDTIGSEQTNDVAPKLKRVFRLLSLAKKGPLRSKKPIKWKVTFKPLWSPTDGELADTRLKNAQRDQIYIEQGVVKPEEVAVDLGDVYPNLDVKAREEALKGGERFNPYENQEDLPPVQAALPGAPGAAGATGPTQQPGGTGGPSGGEPLSPDTPMPVLGPTPKAAPKSKAPPKPAKP